MATLPTTASASGRLSYTIHVSLTNNGDPNPGIIVTTNGVKKKWSVKHCTNHIGYYLAILECTIDAVVKGADGADFIVGNQVVTRQLNGLEEPQTRHTIALLDAIKIVANPLSGGISAK